MYIKDAEQECPYCGDEQVKIINPNNLDVPEIVTCWCERFFEYEIAS